MMDAGWAEKEQEDTGAKICRELMEKLDIKSYETVAEGLSGDRKFHVETSDGGHFLLRLSDEAEYEQKKAAFDRMRKADSIAGSGLTAAIFCLPLWRITGICLTAGRSASSMGITILAI